MISLEGCRGNGFESETCLHVLTSFVFLASISSNPGLAQSKWSTPAQVEGPYYPRTKPKEVDSNLLDFLGRGLPDGEPLQLKGRVFDQKGVLIEGQGLKYGKTTTMVSTITIKLQTGKNLIGDFKVLDLSSPRKMGVTIL